MIGEGVLCGGGEGTCIKVPKFELGILDVGANSCLRNQINQTTGAQVGKVVNERARLCEHKS